jgi:hypothetical protein
MRFFWYRDLKLREKAYLTLLCLFANSLGSGLLAQDVSRFFLVTFFMGGFVFGTYLMSLRCPKCKTPIMKNELHLFGFNTHMWKPIPRKHCSNCGYDLTR